MSTSRCSPAQSPKLSSVQKKIVVTFATGALLVGMAAASTGLAQTSNSSPQGPATHEENERVVIHAPQLVVRRMPDSGTPANIRNAEVITGEKEVSFADLDLSKPGDVMVLQERISDMARDICSELERLHPRRVFQRVVNRDCVQSAIDEGMSVVKDLVVAANE